MSSQRNLTYGRDKNTLKKLCDGTKQDTRAPASSCYNDEVEDEILHLLRSSCHTEFECTVTIPTLVIEGCDMMRRELKTEHICGI